MSTATTSTNGSLDPTAVSRAKNPRVNGISHSAEESVDFMLWASAQATSLSRLKIFHTLAKQVNDQQ